ncbi:MAG: hypothetical protein J6M05_05685 [Cardiobacteriaceae bacterium]|nr:hypothetical protein [Cardiobacteriaceae bacterium]
MARSYSSSKGGSRSSSSGGRSYSSARAHQKCGSSNSFGGYTKVKHSNGLFSMQKTDGKK